MFLDQGGGFRTWGSRSVMGSGQIMNGLQSSELEAARARASARVAPCWMPCRSEGAGGSTTASRTQGSGGSIQDLE